jgi:hypothetical protein
MEPFLKNGFGFLSMLFCTVLQLKVVNHHVQYTLNMPMLGSTQADFIDITLDRVHVMYECT